MVAQDRRGHCRSEQVGMGHDIDHYASDPSAYRKGYRSGDGLALAVVRLGTLVNCGTLCSFARVRV